MFKKLFNHAGKRLMFTLDPETAHGLTIKALSTGIVPPCNPVIDRRLNVNLAGLRFPNPLGVAAGFDKNAEVPDAMLRLGFGFTEIGTVTPRPQPGNPKPRVFRLPQHEGVINRLGFNNQGHPAALDRLEKRDRSLGICGVNIGANKDSADFIADYARGITVFSQVADYFTVNISSPNTPGLRNLQAGEALKRLLDAVLSTREKSAVRPPVFLKLAPDLTEDEIASISRIIAASSIDGVMISNTTLSRNGVAGAGNADEAGGLSGRPLFHRSTVVLARFREQLPQAMPLIGIGGIMDGKTAVMKLEAGASLLQMYTGMIYGGPSIAGDINRVILDRLERSGLASVSDLSGIDTHSWAAKPLEI